VVIKDVVGDQGRGGCVVMKGLIKDVVGVWCALLCPGVPAPWLALHLVGFFEPHGPAWHMHSSGRTPWQWSAACI